MVNQSFYAWLIYLMIGIAILGMIPSQYRGWLILIIVLGSIALISRLSPGGLYGNFYQELIGNTATVGNTHSTIGGIQQNG